VTATIPVDEEVDATPKRRRLLVVLVLLLVLGGAAAGAWLVFGPAGDAEAAEEEPEPDGAVVTLEPQTTTLGEQGLQHARVGIAIVLAEGEDPMVVDQHAPLLQDALVAELAEVGADELRSSEGSAALRASLSGHAKRIWGEEVVHRVVLTELLVQ
jgi:flagellar FliL protein